MASTMRVPTIFTAVDNFSSVVKKMTAGVSNFNGTTSSAIDRFNRKANAAANSMAVAGTAIIAPLGVAVNAAIKFEDKMTDVAKTTGLSAEESDAYGKAILDMSKKTRTSISALQDIGIVAGTIGVAKNELVAFTKAGNEFAIALGKDFGSTEEAVTQVAKLKNLFKETRNIDIATSMTKAGSAINEVSNVAGSSANINEFMLRIGALPDAMKPTIQQSAALGGFLEDAGLSAEIAAGGFSNLILVAGKNMTGFARQMGMTVQSANALYSTDPTQFALKFSKSLNKLKPRELAMTLDQLKIGSQESIKVVGALGSGYEKLTGSSKMVNGVLVEQKGILELSNQAFKDGISITAEADKKNGNLAGKLEMAKNNMEALSIIVGTKLAPVLTKIIDKITPIVESLGKWADDNSDLIITIAEVGLALFALSATIKAITIVTNIYKWAMTLYAGAAKAVTVAQWLWNAAMWANPIGLIVAGIIALIAVIVIIIAKWDEWGAAITLFMGPIGLVISGFKSFYDHWESIKTAFKTDGIIGGLKRIGQVLLDVLLKPLQQLFEMVGLDSWADKIKKFRSDMKLITEGEMKATLEAPEAKQAKATANATVNGQVNVNVSAKGGATAKVSPMNNFGNIPVRTTSTQGSF